MLRRFITRSALAVASIATVATTGGGYYFLNSGPIYHASTKETRRPPPPWTPPSRDEMLQDLISSESGEQFDVLIVGGGATGSGVAVDAATRGLRVALVERDDFSSGE
jgi:glycerol-3-phosphate dehydrogenase